MTLFHFPAVLRFCGLRK